VRAALANRDVALSIATGTGGAGEIRAYYRRILPFFEAELRDRGDEEFWTRAAGEPPDCRVLELGAGTGRATAFLARRARRVAALDLSPELVALARRRLARLPHVGLLVADMREVRLRERFDLIVAVDDPFVHLTCGADRDRAFAVVAEHLAPGGRFLLDAAWRSPQERHAAAEPQGLVIERALDGRDLQVRETWSCHPETRLCTARFEYRRRGRLMAGASFPARLWSLEELRCRARTAGMEISRLWGDYDRKPWDRETSPRLIAEMKAAARFQKARAGKDPKDKKDQKDGRLRGGSSPNSSLLSFQSFMSFMFLRGRPC
jgi:SAM-dependent methyltransferase